MKFKIAHDGDIEAGTAFMLAHSHLLGYQNRADYLGNFFYRFEQDAKAREQLEHTDIFPGMRLLSRTILVVFRLRAVLILSGSKPFPVSAK